MLIFDWNVGSHHTVTWSSRNVEKFLHMITRINWRNLQSHRSGGSHLPYVNRSLGGGARDVVWDHCCLRSHCFCHWRRSLVGDFRHTQGVCWISAEWSPKTIRPKSNPPHNWKIATTVGLLCKMERNLWVILRIRKKWMRDIITSEIKVEIEIYLKWKI